MKHLRIFAFVTVLLGCNEVVPGTCRPNTTGGAGGGDTMPIGAGVGVSASGDYATDPPKGPLDNGNGDSACSDPCMECPSAPAGLKAFCRKQDWGAVCSERCFAKSIPCVPLALHPFKADGGTGKLIACNDLAIGYMCDYQFPNGDDCHFTFGNPFPNTCTYVGSD